MEKGRERKVEDGEEELMGIKLKRGIFAGKGGGPCTPPPTWTFGPSCSEQQEETKAYTPTLSSGSARQLGANLWEVYPHLQKLSKMENGVAGGGSRRRQLRVGGQKNKGLEIQTVPEEDPVEGDSSTEQPESSGSFHRQIAASLMRHHHSFGRNVHALQPVSPATYSSSLEVTPYNPFDTPSSSLEFRGRTDKSSYSLKTSTELLKVLNRIWSLEEQHASNISLIKTLKVELDNSRARIKELVREKQMDRNVIDDLMKKVTEDDLPKKNLEQDRIKSTLRSIREELEDERKLRKRSESLHRKLARELSGMKLSFNKAVSELERERNSWVLLEDLCDEFAMGIRDYEQEVRSLKHKKEMDQVCREADDSLVLHISEAWLDERMQMEKLADAQSEIQEKSMVLDKLGSEIAAFLEARQSPSHHKMNDLPTKELRENCLRRQSLESLHLNEMTSAPKNADDDDDTIDSESNHFEISKTSGLDNGDPSCGKFTENAERNSQLQIAGKFGTAKRTIDPQNRDHGLSSLRARFQQHMAKTLQRNNGRSKRGNNIPDEALDAYQESEIQVVAQDGLLERNSKRFGNLGGGNPNCMVQNLLRSNSSLEGNKIHPEGSLARDSHGHFLLAGTASPVKKWESIITLQAPDVSESSSKPTRVTGENTLKAKLLEARLEGRSHTKYLQGSF